MKIGVCYYPEQWDEAYWPDDAKRMVDAGIEIVRIGEFAWSFMEPSPGKYQWEWLDRAIQVLADTGLKIILGTPTATPPKWLIDLYPEILARDRHGMVRRFGSRRHYCFSSPAYARETVRIVTAMAKRYGRHEALYGWQTDNEYGCHDTIRSYSDSAEEAFRGWLKSRYQDMRTLNRAWGTNFWSQTYRSFDEVELPNLTVTEPNPSHVLDFYRFSSDQVVAYNRLQTDILRKNSPGIDIYHNFMGHFTDFDHFAVSADIDVASWDSYPLGFLDQENYAEIDKVTYMRQGHPDFAGFHHDLYRACGRGRFAVMEQQPGPVNWAPNNPAPLKGMLRLWGHEVCAHGGEMISYFRWRQAPFAQENMHAGLLRHDNEPTSGLSEVRQLADDLMGNALEPKVFQDKADIALVFSYETVWMSEIKPQGSGWDVMRLILDWYGMVREQGQNVDIVEPGTSLKGYKLVLVPSLFHVNEEALNAFKHTDAQILFGPRCGSVTQDMHLPGNLAPGPLQALMPLKIIRSESFPERHFETGFWEAQEVATKIWLDHTQSDNAPIVSTLEGIGLLYRHENYWLVTGVPDQSFRQKLTTTICKVASLKVKNLPEGLRLRTGNDGSESWGVGVNYNGMPIEWKDHKIPPASVMFFKP